MLPRGCFFFFVNICFFIRQFPNCPKSAQSKTSFCVRHGGGRKCSIVGCVKVARGRTSHCAAHGGGVRCCMESCNKAAVGRCVRACFCMFLLAGHNTREVRVLGASSSPYHSTPPPPPLCRYCCYARRLVTIMSIEGCYPQRGSYRIPPLAIATLTVTVLRSVFVWHVLFSCVFLQGTDVP